VDSLSLFDVQPSAPFRQAAAVPTATGASVAPAVSGPLLLAVDGNSLAHRAFHAYSRVDESLGHARGGLYGFVTLLCAISDKVGADGLVVGFDCRTSSQRRARHAEYKANRSQKDPALYDLLDEAPTVLVELGVPVVVPQGWEADDVCGSAAAAAADAGWRCMIATSDRDAFGLIDETTTVLRLKSGLDNAVEYTPAVLQRELGITPQQYLEYAAMRGDTSDNLAGITGIGPSRAKALLSAYPTVADAVADPIGCRSVLGKALGQALIDDVASPESVFARNVELMRIRRDLPVALDDCRPTATIARVERCLQTWELQALTRRVMAALAAKPEAAPLPAEAPY
jgi:DNA polymerase I